MLRALVPARLGLDQLDLYVGISVEVRDRRGLRSGATQFAAQLGGALVLVVGGHHAGRGPQSLEVCPGLHHAHRGREALVEGNGVALGQSAHVAAKAVALVAPALYRCVATLALHDLHGSRRPRVTWITWPASSSTSASTSSSSIIRRFSSSFGELISSSSAMHGRRSMSTRAPGTRSGSIGRRPSASALPGPTATTVATSVQRSRESRVKIRPPSVVSLGGSWRTRIWSWMGRGVSGALSGMGG